MTRFLALGWLFLPAGGQDVFEFRVVVSRVYVDVFITRRGAAVPELSVADFEVYDDGTRRDVVLVETASIPESYALVLDESGSIRGRKRDILSKAVREFASNLDEEDELTVLSFSRRTHLRLPLTFVRPRDGADAYDIRSGGWTALYDALFLAMSYLRNARGRPILVAFTDGMDNASFLREEDVLQAARSTEVVAYAVQADAGPVPSRPGEELVAGGSSGRSVAALHDLARLTGGRVVEAVRQDSLSEAFREILEEVSTRYLLTFSPGPDATSGWHQLVVKVRGVRDADVRARAGYFVSGSR